jgi:glycosyltransferase involved in cell wall biosynthesis
MKILQVSYVFPPKLSIGDGITTVAYNISKELARRGHEVTVYTSNALDLSTNRRLREPSCRSVNGVKVHYLNYIWRYHTHLVTPSIAPLLRRTIRNFDIVHIHDARSYQGIVTALFAKRNGVPYVYQPHGSFLSGPTKSWSTQTYRRLLDRIISTSVVRNSSRVLALNRTEASLFMDGLGLPKERIVIVPNGLDLEAYRELPPKGDFKKRYNLPEHKKLILYLGRIHSSKGIALMLAAYACILKDKGFNGAVLVLAGPDDGYMASAQNLAKSLGISDSVVFTGFIENEDKLNALVDADVFVTPSFTGFPITFLEACISGLPIVTTTSGDYLEWIDNNVGCVCSPTPAALANAIASILTDEVLRRRFSESAKSIVKTRFSLSSITNSIEAIYDNVIESKEAPLGI